MKNNALTYDKYTFRSNVSLKITKDLTASINLGGRYDTTNRPWFPFYDIFKSTRVNPPTTSIYANDNPDYYNNFSYVPNPAAMIDADYTGSAKERNKNLQTQFALEYNIPYVKGLKVKGTFIYDYNNYGYKATRKGFKTYTYGEYTGEYTAADANYPALLQDNRRESERVDMQFQTNYNRTFGNHTIGATYVFERREEKANWMNGERKFDFFTIGELDNARESDQKVSGSSEHQAYLSHIGRLTYDYKGKYLAELACRYDGSYRYAPGSRWAFFPSASVGWRISEESFIKDNFKFVDNLKLRLGYGKTGNSSVDPYQTRGKLGKKRYVYNNGATEIMGYAPSLMANSTLTWETTDQWNIGLDFGFLKNRINGSVELYLQNTHDLLLERQLPVVSGFSSVMSNVGSTRNKGIEITLNTRNIQTKNFTWSTDWMFSANKEEIVELYNGKSDDIGNRWFIGNPIDVYYNYEKIGIWQDTPEDLAEMAKFNEKGGNFTVGSIRLRDVDGDYKITDKDKIILGNERPKFVASLVNNIEYKGFDFSIFLYASVGRMLKN